MVRSGPAAAGNGPVRCVGAIIVDGARMLLVKRGHEPARGRWSVPGGRVEPGETDEQAVIREVREETGLTVRVGRVAGQVDIPAGSATYRVTDYVCVPTAGILQPGDDADDARWATLAEAASLPMTDNLLVTLQGWGVLPSG
jgi:ADP-ribose pyrophosphatase YjhB (NUDIX family)